MSKAATQSRRKIAASIMGRTSLRSAAATALLLTAPYLFAGSGSSYTRTTQAGVTLANREKELRSDEPVVDLLSVPMDAEVADASVSLAMIAQDASGTD